MTPDVTFVVPCYNLAHLLPECIESILAQSHGNFEVLIMDDCSPDDTPKVAQSFVDHRIQHIRNDPNLGHLRNYNRGIERAQGRYVWLISADDRLRRPYVLERYVRLMEQHPEVGYVFCPAVGLENGSETGILDWTVGAAGDAVVDGHRFLNGLIDANMVSTPSGMVRRECYQRLGTFPLDLPYAGDWFLWCLFALHYDVAYLAEPMVNYRLHAHSMTNGAMRRLKLGDLLAVRWRIKRLAREMGCEGVTRTCIASIAHHYAYCLVAERFRSDHHCMTVEEFEASLQQYADGPDEQRRVRARVYASVGDGCYAHGELRDARHFYGLALEQERWMPKVWTKSLLVRSGVVGTAVRRGVAAVRPNTATKTLAQ